jgi:hypothetical protein
MWDVAALLLSLPPLLHGAWRLRGFVQDDALIYLRVADVFLRHGNLGYNPGENVEAFTGFLWQWLTIAALWLGGSPVSSLKLFGLLLALGTQVFLFHLALRLLGNKLWALVFTILFAFYPPRILWFTSGLETELFVFSVVWGAAGFLEVIHHPNNRSFRRISPAFALMVLARPEAPILMGAAFCALMAEPRLRRLSYIVNLLLIPTLVYVALLVFRLNYFGLPFPNTFYAKEAGGIWLMKRGYYAVKGFGQKNFNMFFSVFALMGWVTLWREARERGASVFLASWAGAFGLHFVKSGGDLMPEERLLLPMMPGVFVSAAVFVKSITEFFSTLLVEWTRKSLTSGLIPGILIALSAGIASQYFRKVRTDFAGHNEVIAALEACHADAGRIMDARAVPGDKAVVTDAGMTAWVAPHVRFIDFLGLGDTTASMIFYRNNFNPWAYEYCFWYPACDTAKKKTEADFVRYFIRENPRWVVCNIIPGEGTPTQALLREYIHHPPDSIRPEIADVIIMWRYFGVWFNDSIRKSFKPVKVYEYNPNYFLMLVERRH